MPVDDPAVRLICFPHAGRGGAMFRSWTALLPTGVELCAVNLPGRESRFGEPLVTGMDPLVDALLVALRPLLGDVPVAFFGHSMGALVAFELCLRLAGEGAPTAAAPSHLVVSGCPPPHRQPPIAAISGLDDEGFVAALRRLDGTAEELLGNAEAMDLLLPVLRADYRLAEDYQRVGAARATAALPCPITVLSGSADPETGDADLGGWSELTTGGCVLRRFGGDHFFLDAARPMVVAAVTAALLPHLIA